LIGMLTPDLIMQIRLSVEVLLSANKANRESSETFISLSGLEANPNSELTVKSQSRMSYLHAHANNASSG
jgi:hypothetical protein